MMLFEEFMQFLILLNIYLLKVNIETLELGVKHVQSWL